MNEITFEVLKLIVMIGAGFMIGVYGTLRTKHGQDFDTAYSWAKVAVLWAQQILWAKTGMERKGLVTDFMQMIRNKYKINLTDEQIEVLIEAAVNQMNTDTGIGYIEVEKDGIN